MNSCTETLNIQKCPVTPKFVLAHSFNIFNKYYEHLFVLSCVLSNRDSVLDKRDPNGLMELVFLVRRLRPEAPLRWSVGLQLIVSSPLALDS